MAFTEGSGVADEADAVVRLSRMEAFSDGVFAIAIPCWYWSFPYRRAPRAISLEPYSACGPLILPTLSALPRSERPGWAITSITHYMHGVNTTFLRVNLALLLVVSFLPFPTKLVAEYLGSREDEKVAATILGITLLAVTSLLSVLWTLAVRSQLVHPDTGDEEITLLSQRLRPSLALYLVLIVVGWFVPLAAVIGYLVIAFFLIFPLNLRRREKSQPAAG